MHIHLAAIIFLENYIIIRWHLIYCLVYRVVQYGKLSHMRTNSLPSIFFFDMPVKTKTKDILSRTVEKNYWNMSDTWQKMKTVIRIYQPNKIPTVALFVCLCVCVTARITVVGLFKQAIYVNFIIKQGIIFQILYLLNPWVTHTYL